MRVKKIVYPIAVLLLAGPPEFGGGYLIWLWFREGKLYIWNVRRTRLSFIWGWLLRFKLYLCLVVYSAYGGVFNILSVL